MRALWLFLMGIAMAVPGLYVPAAKADGPRFEVTPFVGYRVGGQFEAEGATEGSEETVDLDDGSSWGIDLGLYRDQASFYELLYSRQSAGLDSHEAPLAGVDVVTEYLHFGGTLLFADERFYAPYLSVTVGATRLSADQGGYDDETSASASIGGGFRLPLGDTFAITAGVRAYVTFINTDTDILCISTGEGSGCLLKSSGSTFWQGEAQLGLTARF
jgi:Outer membrane protein beta-barrel domain